MKLGQTFALPDGFSDEAWPNRQEKRFKINNLFILTFLFIQRNNKDVY